MHLVLGQDVASLLWLTWLNDCANGDEADFSFVQTKKKQKKKKKRKVSNVVRLDGRASEPNPYVVPWMMIDFQLDLTIISLHWGRVGVRVWVVCMCIWVGMVVWM